MKTTNVDNCVSQLQKDGRFSIYGDADCYNPFFDIRDVKHLRWGTKLPHWHQDGKYVFVTFRLADSIPQNKLLEYKEEKEMWLKRHPRPWDADIQQEYDQKFGKTIDKWLDNNYGSCVLRSEKNRKIVEDALHFFDGKRYHLKAFVVMPNHVHLFFQMIEGYPLEKVMRSLKSFTAKAINKELNREGRLWQSESYDHIVRDEDEYKHVLKYILSNNSELAWIKDDAVPL